MVHVAVVLSGAGHRDGSELREACYALLALDQVGAQVSCFAPDMQQRKVVNHLTGEEEPGDRRNVLVESARIARGNIAPMDRFEATQFDALVFPGGFGGALNLSDFAVKGAEGAIEPTVAAAIDAMFAAQKPIGFICITPASLGALALGKHGVGLTIGDDPDTAAAIEKTGAKHVVCATTATVIDGPNKVVSTPAYMDPNASPAAVYQGIKALVDAVVQMADA